jgi:membrane-bound ClpP family serine protease
MWIVVGVLLGVVLLSSLLGFHAGPHAHVFAAGLGVAVAVFLFILAATGHSSATLWTLFGADLAVSAGVGTIGWKGLSTSRVRPYGHGSVGLVGVEGVAVTDLAPEGIVRIRGENWSSTSLNGTVHAGDTVQVVKASGVRLSVWSDDAVDDETERPIIESLRDDPALSALAETDQEGKAGSQ